MNKRKGSRELLFISVCHYIYGGMFLVLSMAVVLLYLDGIKSMMDALPKTSTALIFWIVLLSISFTYSICLITSGYFIIKKIRYQFSWNFARIEIAFFPLGTILGFFTLYVLSKDSIKSLYEIKRQ
jgi:hypothetical protein